MKRDLVLAAVLALVAIGCWAYFHPASDGVRTVGGAELSAVTPLQSQSETHQSEAVSTAAMKSAEAAPSPAAEAMATEAQFLAFVSRCKAQMGSDPFYSKFVENHPECAPSAPLIKRYNELHVLPYHPVVAEDCVEHYSSDEDMSPGELCTLRPRNTYSGATKAQLLGWATAGDAVAASLLVEYPTATPQERFDAALDAYRLSGKPAELVRYVEQYVVEPLLKVDPVLGTVSIDRGPSAIAALNAYVLSRLARVKGDQRAEPEVWQARFTQYAEALAAQGFDIEATQRAVESLVAARLGEGVGDA